MDTLEELKLILRSRPLSEAGELVRRKYSALFYATQILRLLRTHSDQYRILRFHIPGKRFITELAEQLEPLVRQFFQGGMMPSRSEEDHLRDITPLITELERLGRIDIYHPLLLARALAVAMNTKVLSMVTMKQFRNYYREIGHDKGTPEVMARVRPEDPVPTCFNIFGRPEEQGQASRKTDYGTNPQNLPGWRFPDRLPRVVLAPDIVSSFDLRLNFQYARELQNVQRDSTVVATFHPTKELNRDFSFWVDAENYRFFDVRARCASDPADSQIYATGLAPFATRQELRDWCIEAIRKATDAGAKLFIFPELMLHESDVESIFQCWGEVAMPRGGRAMPDYAKPQLMIPGSWHTHKHAPLKRNDSELWGTPRSTASRNTSRGTSITKVVPYVHTLSRDDNLTEHITTTQEPALVLFCSENATMMVLICVDFLLDKLRDLVRDLYVSLVLIPSLSQKSRIFRELMIGHVAATQAVAIFVDSLQTKDEGRATVATVRHPELGSLDVSTRTVRGLTSERGVAIINLDSVAGSPRVNWIRC